MTERTTLRIDPGNTDQARAWDGDEGAKWAADADRFDDSLRAHHPPFMAAAAITATDEVVDVGCGTGRTTIDAASIAREGSAHGVDLSARMLDVARARARAGGVSNVRFTQADAQVHPFPPGAYDVAISRTSASFLGDPVAGLANVGRALRPRGRLALLTWQAIERNEWLGSLRAALSAGRDLPAPPPDRPGPFGLSDPDRIRAVLGAADFADVRIESLELPMCLGRDAAEAERFVLGLLGWLLTDLDDARREQATTALRASLAAHETPDGVTYGSAAWLVRARRPA
jgi:SAM-dependent methyltransferase